MRLLVSLYMVLVLAVTQPARADLLMEVKQYVTEQSQAHYPEGNVSVSARRLDPRVRLPDCEDLVLELSGERRVGRVAVSARCEQPQPWHLFVTTEIKVTMPIVVTLQSIERNTIISEHHISLETREINRLRRGYLTRLDQVVGRQAKRSIPENTAILDRQIAAAKLVKKGDQVTIRASHGGVTVATSGTALRDGAAGEQIPIRNQRSKRLVNAWVVGRGLVTTLPE